MAEEGGGEGQSKAQGIARTVGVTIRLVNQTRKEVEGIVGVMERVKKLFTSTEKVAQASGAATSGSVASITSRISALGSAAGGGGGGAIAGMFGPIGGAVMGAVGAIQNFGSSIAEIHQSSEDMTNTMAGTFSALGISLNIDEGAADAVAALRSINTAAAALPGEASEYITVFQSGISSLASGFNNNLPQMLEFSNMFAAVGRSLGIDAAQIGRDMNLMTRAGQAGAGADVATFQRMLPFINSYRTSMHQATVTAQTFNTMTQPKRILLLQNAFESLRPMIRRAAETYSAISGEFQGHISTIKSAITAPFFAALKESMKAMNKLMGDYEDRIKTTGASIASFLVNMTKKFGNMLAPLFNEGSPLATAMTTFQKRAGLIWGDLQAGGGGGNQGLGAGAMAGGAALGGPGMALLVGGIASFMTHTEEVGLVMESLVDVGTGLMMILYQFSSIFGTLSEGIGSGLAILLPPVADALSAIIGGLGVFLGYISTIVTSIQEELAPGFTLIAAGLQGFFAGIADFVGPAMQMLGMGLLDIWRNIRAYVVPAFTALGTAIGALWSAIGWVLSQMGRGMAAMNRRNAMFEDQGNDANDPITRMLERLNRPGHADAAAAAAAAAARRTSARTPAARGGNHTHNDFRGSNFDITQKFAEGFDPDRIAAGFVSDLESAATNRIQGGFEPLFSIR